MRDKPANLAFKFFGWKANEEYWKGVRKLKQWHEYCEMKRIKAKAKEMSKEPTKQKSKAKGKKK